MKGGKKIEIEREREAGMQREREYGKASGKATAAPEGEKDVAPW